MYVVGSIMLREYNILHLFSFLDIDECYTGDDFCHMNATCTNVNGSYVCKCENGFTGDGFNCSSKVMN